MYEKLYRNIIFPFYEDVVRRRGTYKYFREISSAPYMSREEIAAMQAEKLNRIITYASKNVPYYKRFFAERGIDPKEIRTIGQVRETGLVITKDILRMECDGLLSNEFDKDDLLSYSTSGSTGDPIIVYMTPDQYGRRDSGKYRVEDWVGKEPGARTTIIWGRFRYEEPIKKIKNFLYWKLRNYQYLSAFDISDCHLVEYVGMIRKHRSRFVEGYVSVLYQMALSIERHGVEPPPLEGIITGAEALYDFQREQIERSFKCPVFDRYGSSEFKSIAGQCLNRKGMHINEDALIVEVVDDEDRPLTGEPGTILVTDLENFAMPLIRYRIGDIGVLSDEICGCGRNFRMLDKVIGRETDILVFPDGTRMTGMFIAWKFVRVPGVRRYQVIQESISELRILIESDGTETQDVVREWVTNAFDELRENGMSFLIEFVDHVPRTKSGKMKFFVSMLEKDHTG